MVEIVEAKGWQSLSLTYVVDIGSLEDLKKLAEGKGERVIIRRGKEYLFFNGQVGQAPVCYRFKE